MSDAKPSRRQEYAEATRRAIVDAARKLFAERGYFSTRVEDIAAEARVAPATVYAVAGGKQALLSTLIDTWTGDPIVVETLSNIDRVSDSEAIIRELASASRLEQGFAVDAAGEIFERVAEQERGATDYYRDCISSIAERLVGLGELRPGVEMAEVVDVLWFFFGYASYFTLHEDNHWSYERAERWLADQAVVTLLQDRAPRRMDTGT